MDECFKCGLPGNKVRLFDAISGEGIEKICGECAKGEDIPIIKRPTTEQLKESERKQSVYQRLSRVAGFGRGSNGVEGTPEVTLREIVDMNLKDRPVDEDSPASKPRPDLVENFHWIIMRARRMKKISHTQLAREIGESEVALKMAEKGILPEDDYILVNKLEKFLGIKLLRGDVTEELDKIKPRRLAFDDATAKNLTIGELQKMKQDRGEVLGDVKREEKVISEKPENGDLEEDIEEVEIIEDDINLGEEIVIGDEVDNKELTDEEVDDILYGRK